MIDYKDSSLVKKPYDKIEDDIISRRLQPGEPLVEEHLSERLKVSRTSLRAALRTLNHEGLVRIIPKKGAIVHVLPPQDIMAHRSLIDVARKNCNGKEIMNGS